LGKDVYSVTPEVVAARKEEAMPLLWVLVVLLIIFAVAGGVAIHNLLWLVLVVALVLAILAFASGRRTV
jgi:diacylglycerol kinase